VHVKNTRVCLSDSFYIQSMINFSQSEQLYQEKEVCNSHHLSVGCLIVAKMDTELLRSLNKFILNL